MDLEDGWRLWLLCDRRLQYGVSGENQLRYQYKLCMGSHCQGCSQDRLPFIGLVPASHEVEIGTKALVDKNLLYHVSGFTYFDRASRNECWKVGTMMYT